MDKSNDLQARLRKRSNSWRMRRWMWCLVALLFLGGEPVLLAAPSTNRSARQANRSTPVQNKPKQVKKSNAPSKPATKPQTPSKPAQESPKPAEEDEVLPIGDEQGMPLWSEKDQKLVLQGTWWKQNESVLPGVEVQTTAPSTPVASTMEEETAVVDPFPVDTAKILDRFLPEYLQPDGDGVLDPQKFLTEVERDDVQKLIQRIYELYKVKLYVSIFAKDQEVPAEVNAPTLARQIFDPAERCMLLHVHLGDVKSMQIACDSTLNEKIGDIGRRILLQRVKESALRYSDSMDELTEAMSSMVIFVQPALKSASQQESNQKQEGNQIDIPTVDIQYAAPPPPPRSPLADTIESVKAYCIQNAEQLIIAIVALAVAIILLVWQRSMRTIELKVPDRLDGNKNDEKLLGCPNGCSCCSPRDYADYNDNPETIGRQQMRDHMRSVARP